MRVILYKPQIPQNTGNIARSCAATGTGLGLVQPGFSLADRHMKRAGLDYWDRVCVEMIEDLEFYLVKENKPCFFFSSKAKISYDQAKYTEDSLLVFGSETEGLPDCLWHRYPERFYTIPMIEDFRCLNLASSAAIVLYEALRQMKWALPSRGEKRSEHR